MGLGGPGGRGWEDIWGVVHYDEHLVLEPLGVVRHLDDAEGDGLVVLVRMQAGASDDCEGAFRGAVLEEPRSQTLAVDLLAKMSGVSTLV